MRREALQVLRCPACHGTLEPVDTRAEEIDEGALRCQGCVHEWSVEAGIPQLVYPDELQGQDLHSRKLWDRLAPFYDRIAVLTDLLRGVPGREERMRLLGRLELGPGSLVLEMAAGTGENLKLLAGQMGDDGTVYGLDLSPRTLARAARKLTRLPGTLQLVAANATSAPFADAVFDSLLDGFGMKYYSDRARAIREMLRVVKPGGKVVITDLGLPPGKRRTFRQRLLLLWIPGFRDGPPLDVIPSDVKELRLEWDAHETAYTIEFRKVLS